MIEKYKKLNDSFTTTLTYKWCSNGFFSEFNNMIFAMLWCLDSKVKFQVYSKDYHEFNGKGIASVFKPVLPETTSIIHKYLNGRYIRAGHFGTKQDIQYRLSSLYKALSGNYFMYDTFNYTRTMWFRKLNFDIPELGIHGDIQSACRKLIPMVYQFNDYYEEKIQRIISDFDIPQNYIGIHVRAGDKDTERVLSSLDEYMQKAYAVTTTRNAFIMTDDYTLFQQLVDNYPDWNFYTLTFPHERGFNINEIKKQTPEQRVAAKAMVFATLRLMEKAECFIGTVSSNPGMFLGMIMDINKVHYIDSQEWIIL